MAAGLGGCTIIKPSGEGSEGSEGEGGVTDGASDTGSQSSQTNPSTQTAVSEISGADGSETTHGGLSNGTSEGGDPSDTEQGFTTNGDPTEEPHDDSDTEGDDCNGDTWTHVPEGEGDFNELVEAWDRSGYTPISCPYDDNTACSEAAIPGVAGLVIRNDALPVPKDFVTGSARWLVWSNTPLSCADPLGSQLCAGEWRLSWAMYAEMWCHSVREYPGEHGWGIGGNVPFLIEVGDADCETSAHTIAEDDVSNVRVRFADNGVLPPYFEPEKDIEMCAACSLPGTPPVISGKFDAIICPE